MNKKIFVSIPAWEDTHLIDTMNHILDTAYYPENIVFGLGLNYKEEPDLSMFYNVKIVRDQDIAEGQPGIVGIREAIRGLIEDEDYFLGIDAHADFELNWDTALIDDIEELTKNNEKRIISRQATANVQGKHNWKTKWIVDGDFDNLDLHGEVVEFDSTLNKDKVNEKYFKNYYISCNFIFAKCSDIKAIKFPSYHRFPFEEPEQSIAVYCQGYDVVAPYADNIVHYAGNDVKYLFPYDERWWKFVGTDRNDPNHWTRIWILDDEEMTKEVKKLMIMGKNKYFNILNYTRSIVDFYNEIDMEENYWKVRRSIINSKTYS